MPLEFQNEMLIPTINSEVYFAIYDLENWLRRICLTAYMVEFGAEWINSLPGGVRDRIRHRYSRNHELFYLDADNDDNLIWMATHGELAQMLMQNTVWPQVEALTGFSRERFAAKIDELRDIRNILAHNRALSETTEVIARGIIVALRLAIQRFKNQILYDEVPNTLIFGFGDDEEEDSIAQYFSEKMEKNDSSHFQAYIKRDSRFYTLVCLPVSRRASYISASKLLQAYKGGLQYIVAFTINKSGDEYCVLLPHTIPEAATRQIIDVFVTDRDIWTNTGYENQHPKFVCNPKIWFYENNRIIEE